MNTRQAFQKASTLTGHDPKPKLAAITDPISFAGNLNTFYTRFDTMNYSEECKTILDTLPHPLSQHTTSYRTVSVTTVWKTATIILVPKKPHLSKPNHYRSVALTYQHHPPNYQTTLESKPVHKVKRGTEDAVACLLHPPPTTPQITW